MAHTTQKSAPQEALPSPMRIGLCFTARRLRAYCDYLDNAAAITDPAAFVQLNMAFWTRAQNDYALEAGAALRAAHLLSPLSAAEPER